MDYSTGFMHLWHESSNGFPIGMHHFDKKVQKQHEKQFEDFLRQMQEKAKYAKANPSGENKSELLALLTGFFRETLAYSDEQLQVILSDDMVDSTFHFINAARFYDPTMNFHDIFQACRNVWILNGIQFLLGEPVKMTPPIFAYSMLYPYTDNYLDDPEISFFDKLDFSNRFAQRLSGEFVEARNGQENKIFSMVEIIEDYWARANYPKVYESLLAIHDAQTQSVVLITQSEQLSLNDRFRICVHKGGTSVIADGYLVLGNLTEKQEEFFYYYGAYLQLLDDLQDVSDDLNDSLMTGFSSVAATKKLDGYLNKTYDLGLKILSCVDRLGSPHADVFKSLMKKSIDLFLVESVVTNFQFFEYQFVHDFESYSPLSFSFVRKKNGTFSPYQDQLFEQILKHAIVDQDSFSLGFLHKKSLLKQEQQAV